ncbi:hypothetical protein EE612_054065 [Oryza sativa]
MTSSTR